MQSVFTDISKSNFRDPSNYYVIPSVPGLASNSVASAAWLSSEGEALFALPSASGGIFVLKLPPHDVPGKEQEQAACSPLPNTAQCSVPSPALSVGVLYKFTPRAQKLFHIVPVKPLCWWQQIFC